MIRDQNRDLAAAANKPKDNSDKKANAEKVSAKISSKKLSSKHAARESRADFSGKENAPIKGSYEGLQHSAKALLSQNGVGYDNKSLQFARYADKSISHNTANFSFNYFSSASNSGIMDNYSSVSSVDSSSYRVDRMNRANKLF